MAMTKKGKAGGTRDGLENLGAPCPIATGAGRGRAGGTWTRASDTEARQAWGFFYILDNWSKRPKPLF